MDSDSDQLIVVDEIKRVSGVERIWRK